MFNNNNSIHHINTTSIITISTIAPISIAYPQYSEQEESPPS